MEEKDFYQTLVQRYLNKQLSGEELEVFIELTRSGKLDAQFDAVMDFEINNMMNVQPKQPITRKLWYKFAVAASVLLVVATSIFFLFNQKNGVLVQQDIDPGSYKAVLTLADGRQIALTDAANGKLAVQNGIQITKAADGQLIYEVKDSGQKINDTPLFNHISTPKGGQYQINLPDGTRVWLNAASSLKFPASFTNLKERRVELTGEAYFEVAKNKNLPFLVSTHKQKVEVLGTHFNINSYDNELAVKTTLLEGSIMVSTLNNTVKKLLKPGEQSILQSGQIEVNAVDTESEIAWKDGNFNFEDTDIQSIMRKLERWYDLEVIYEGNIPKTTFGGKISVHRPLSKALKLLESTGDVHFKVEGRRITVMQ
ncbi:FecR family protein [Pedobacter nyackensis]|uniref:FecR family protein n=1 Tax=Pedobacter nyackensis TaxID=475255 RepID=UPI00292EC7AE|nr:FecR family protein [Pedobacter nyackensis]